MCGLEALMLLLGGYPRGKKEKVWRKIASASAPRGENCQQFPLIPTLRFPPSFYRVSAAVISQIALYTITVDIQPRLYDRCTFAMPQHRALSGVVRHLSVV